MFRSYLILLALLLAPLTQAQEPAPAYSVEIKITAPDGSIVFQQAGESISESLMVAMVHGCEQQTAKQNIGIANPKYDEQQPISDTNQPVLPAKGSTAVAALVKWFLGEMATAYAGQAESQQLLKTKQDEIRAEVSRVKVVDRKTLVPRK